MIELTKRDIEILARQRFTDKYIWRLIVGIAVIIGALITVSMLIPAGTAVWLQIAAMSPVLVLYLLGATRWVRSQNKAVKAFCEDLESDPEIKIVTRG